jgi:Tfp pilus assembly protein PilV
LAIDAYAGLWLKARLSDADIFNSSSLLVTMRTFSARLRVLGRSFVGWSGRSVIRPSELLMPSGNPLASEAGDTLIEVMISAVVLALIVVGTLTGINSANRATSTDRVRSQADALAQQDEERLRSLPVKKLSELSETHEPVLHEVAASGTTFTIASSAKYIADATATVSCTSTTAKADYIQTISTVTWHSLGSAKPVVETGIISPPAAAAVIVHVTGASGEAVPEMNVTATGPSSITTTTSADGCAILSVSPGEYTLNVSRLGYVDQNGYVKSNEDPISDTPFYVAAEETVKRSFEFAPAGRLAVSFKGGETGDSFVAANNLMTSYRKFTAEPAATTIASPTTIFPFTSSYTVYPGTCESDAPSASAIKESETSFLATVTAGTTFPITTIEPPVNLKIMSGTEPGLGKEGTQVINATGSITDSCGVKRSFTETPAGALKHPGTPFGTSTLCVTALIATKQRRYEATINNSTVSGIKETIYLGKATESPASC